MWTKLLVKTFDMNIWLKTSLFFIICMPIIWFLLKLYGWIQNSAKKIDNFLLKTLLKVLCYFSFSILLILPLFTGLNIIGNEKERESLLSNHIFIIFYLISYAISVFPWLIVFLRKHRQ